MFHTDKPVKILVIGNSHGLDATTLLYRVFKAENPEQKVIIGALYISGCSLNGHANNILENKASYIYFKNGDFDGRNADQKWVQTYNENTKEGFLTTVKYALEDEQWDIVSIQQMNRQSGVQDELIANDGENERAFWTAFPEKSLQTIIDFVLEKVKPAPRFVWHMLWPNPDDPIYLGGEGSNPELSLNEGWGKDHARLYPDADGNFSSRVMYEGIVANVKKYLLPPTGFSCAKYFDAILPAGATVQYAMDVQGMTQAQLYRDYTHLSDYSRLMTAYVWYAKLMELLSGELVLPDKIRVNHIPRELHDARLSVYPPANEQGDFDYDEEMRSKILQAVRWALTHPYDLP